MRESTAAGSHRARRETCLFIGREAQLALLRDAFDATCAGRSITVRVRGTSGMGKSTLVQRFLGDIGEGADAIVLRGRAYERESVPYKAVDGVVDALSRHLMRLSEADPTVAQLPGISALARLFPVLRRVPSIGDAAEEGVADPREMRRRAFAALGDLLTVVGQHRPVVLYIDDVQWGDTAPSARGASAPAHDIPGQRGGEERVFDGHAKALARGRRNTRRHRWAARPRRLGATSALLASVDESSERVAEAAAREATGSPFLIEELVRSNLNAGTAGAGTLSILTIEQMVEQRYERLPEGAQTAARDRRRRRPPSPRARNR